MDVEQSWRRITDWLARHAPATAATLRPPMTGVEIDGIAELVGRPLPADLRAWWGLMGGVAERRWAPVY